MSALKHLIFPNIILPTKNKILKKNGFMSVKKAIYYITDHFSDRKHNEG